MEDARPFSTSLSKDYVCQEPSKTSDFYNSANGAHKVSSRPEETEIISRFLTLYWLLHSRPYFTTRRSPTIDLPGSLLQLRLSRVRPRRCSKIIAHRKLGFCLRGQALCEIPPDSNLRTNVRRMNSISSRMKISSLLTICNCFENTYISGGYATIRL